MHIQKLVVYKNYAYIYMHIHFLLVFTLACKMHCLQFFSRAQTWICGGKVVKRTAHIVRNVKRFSFSGSRNAWQLQLVKALQLL